MAKSRVLVVEDEKDIVEMLKINLKKEGYKVYSANSGEDGLAKARELKPDLVLLDSMLPGIDGMEVCRSLKQDSKTRGIPVIMLTAKADETDIVSGLEIGADDYLTKPFSTKVLVAHMRALLRRVRKRDVEVKNVVEIGDLTIDPNKFEVRTGERNRVHSISAARRGTIGTGGFTQESLWFGAITRCGR